MRPKTWSYTPEDNNLTGFLSNATGATWTLTTTTPGDGLAHQVTVRNDSATDHSAKTIALVGTDADGKDQTETLTAPAGSATVTSSKFWKTLTSATPSATIGADTMDIGWNDVAVGPTIPMDWRQTSFLLTMMVDISGTINYDVEYTEQDIWANTPSTLTWLNHGTLVNKTADTDGSTTVPIRAIRLAINSLTAGATISLTAILGG